MEVEGQLKKILYWGLGIFFSIVAMISALLPVLPAVLFWVLAGVYFGKASPRFQHWFTNCWLYRNILVKFMKTEKTGPKRQNCMVLGKKKNIVPQHLWPQTIFCHRHAKTYHQ